MKKYNQNEMLKDKYILITGAGGLMGKEFSSALHEIGANLILTDKNISLIDLKDFRNSKGKIILKKMDVTKESSIKSVLNYLNNRKIYLYGLLNNAAIDPKVKRSFSKNFSKMENINLKTWNDHISVGLTGAWLCAKIFGLNMSKNKQGGVIINVGSDLSVIAPNHNIYKKGNFKPVMYSVIKHGIIGLTKYFATYWTYQKIKIRCNSISPGPVFFNQSKNFEKKIKKHIPLNRMATRGEYRGAIKFLFSNDSSYMNGHNLVIDGGRSIW